MKQENKKDKRIDKAIDNLKQIYSTIPSTKGCLEYIAKPKEDGGCSGWCCSFQTPQVLYSEFLYTWKTILKEWDIEQIANLLELSINSYLSSRITKGCVFFDTEKKMCRQHKSRCYNCRIYGIVPEEEFKPRYERLKVLYQDKGAIIRDQCNLISTSDGRAVTIDDTNRWWRKLQDVEISIGIEEKDIHDGPGGSYLTYHDHILLQVCSDEIMENLQHARVYADEIEKKEITIAIMNTFRKNLNNLMEKTGNELDSKEEMD